MNAEELTATLNMVFIVTFLFGVYTFLYPLTRNVILLYQVKMLLFYNVQTTNVTVVGNTNEMCSKQLQRCVILRRTDWH